MQTKGRNRMIIDIHAHWFTDYYPGPRFFDNYVKFLMSISGRSEERCRERAAELIDPTGDELIAQMDEAGVNITVLSMIDYGLTAGVGEGEYSLLGLHQKLGNLVQKHPDRLMMFGGIDLRRPNAVELLEEMAKEWGIKGLKFHPGSGFYPNDQAFYPFYEKAQELGVKVLLFHTGAEDCPLYSRYSLPWLLDDVTNDFPDFSIIFGHAGKAWWPIVAGLIQTKPNLYCDLGAWQSRARIRPIEQFYGPVRALVDTGSRRKVLWASDWPAPKTLMTQREWIDYFVNPPEDAKAAGLALTEKELGAVMGGNAAKMLGLEVKQ